MIHSGSRNLGKQIYDKHSKIAKDLNAKYHSNVKPNLGLEFLPVDSNEGQAYICEMNFALDFAKNNRHLMMNLVKDVLELNSNSDLDIHHNYANLEHHYGKNVWVHRKGACSARKSEFGIIPSSMGTPSYITRGLGNPESFMSSSHGSGRVMSRTEANRTFTKADFDEQMSNVIHDEPKPLTYGKQSGSIDYSELPSAYKSGSKVMKAQRDLVDIVHTLTPLASIKG